MTDRDGQFWPESLPEQLDQLAQAASHSTGPTMPDARLVEDLRTVYTDYTRAGERVWARLAEHLAERGETPNNVRLIASERLQTERFEHIQVAQGQFATQSAPRPKSPRRSRRIFTLVAAVLAAAVLVGSSLWVLTSIHQPVGDTIVASATPRAAGTTRATPTPALNFPCPRKVSFPDFHALCLDHEIQVTQQSFKLNGNQTLTLVAGYADINSITVWFHLDHTGKNQYVTSMAASSPQLDNELGNFYGGSGGCSPGDSSGQLDCLDTYYLDNVPAGLQALDLNVQESVANGPNDQAPVIAVFSFSLPFHAGRSAHPNLTVTANGISITLKQVLVSPIMTTIDLLNPRLNDALMADQSSPNPLSYFTLTAGDQKLNGRDIIDNSLGTNGKFGPVLGTQLVIDGSHPLLNQYGEWTLTISPKIFSGATIPWVFHFTV
jgi:hypothetical protein